MPLRVVAGPGCDSIGKDQYVEDEMQPGDVVISVAKIYKAVTGSSGVPSENPAALRLALYLRTTAIRQARKNELTGFILTSNGNRADLDRLVEESGAERRHDHQADRGASVRARRSRWSRKARSGARRARNRRCAQALVWALSAVTNRP